MPAPVSTSAKEPARRRRLIQSEAQVTASLAEQRERERAEAKLKFLKVLDEHLGVISYACVQAGVPRRTVYDWMNQDTEFQQAVKDIDHKQLDFVERKLIENINKNDTRAIVFYLSTKGRKRGYSTRVELVTPDDKPLKAEVRVDHAEARDEMGDKALGKALKAAMRANPSAFDQAVRSATMMGQVVRAGIEDED